MKRIKNYRLGAFFALILALNTLTVSAKKIKLGFIPLTDCAPLVAAKELGLFAKYGLDVELSKEASWANIRDKILNGELDGAHCLFSMPFSVYTGIGGKAGSEMKIAMVLNNNGQAITLSKDFCNLLGYKEIAKVGAAIKKIQARKEVTFAMTFPGGTHDIWLRNWLAAAGVNQKSVGIITIPPPQMVANMKVDNMEGFSVGEPWNGVAASQGIGFTHIASQDIWKDHPEKALVVNAAFANTNKQELKQVMKAIIEACKWLDVLSNRKKAASWLTKPYYVNAPLAVIEARLMGSSDLGCDLGVQRYKGDFMTFYKGGLVNTPKKSYGMWFMAQYVRFGMLKAEPNYKAIAEKLVLDDLFAEVAKEMKVPIQPDMVPFKTTYDVSFDPANIGAYLKTTKK
ncbi:CmpA/NrtA family ABC transporter substrate-binding protein [Pedobacter puniceum]|jgi:nitrate/nitrite transport system substrate-binding protein|uniref:Nitrate ABC transporter substrate-binding protein n=1 Tax=Pedobacter puniceum TaxID=2666136 RepID=A0A7K0FML8_9SPHI|nr:CmpA/NrtA family ABC transporter substrate-binding protein [Pedobacter puniceum]MRX47198.1 nitrate ABC transporter substrate-binding protein [Pedobacter puniceum]